MPVKFCLFSTFLAFVSGGPTLKATVSLPADGIVRYSQFGAKGDGQTDDIDAIAKAHAFANKHNLPVRADDDATYYIGGKDRTAIIQTDTDFGTAAFIIDDTEVENRNSGVFEVTSKLPKFTPRGIRSLHKNQEKIDLTLKSPALIIARNSDTKHYIRYGANRNNGTSQTDIFIVDANGNVDPSTPIIWDFDQVTQITAYPIDTTPLTIKGGRFTTIANRAESRYTYYNRSLNIRRSNVVVDSLEHRVTGEGEHGAPYYGFINIADCTGVTVQNTTLTGRKVYETIGAAGTNVSMGSYDITLNRALNASFINCRQTNDINDTAYWGIMGSNFCKNLLLDNCHFSRFDAHMGVYNVTIRNSTLGWQGINTIGSGTLTVENSTIRSKRLINLRPDYGSTWQGQIIIRNCEFIPTNGKEDGISLITGSNSGRHNFGYTCYMPERITISGLRIDDSLHPQSYEGPAIFANFNSSFTSDSYKEAYPYIRTKEVILQDVTTASGKPLRLSDNTFMFKDVAVRHSTPQQ